MKCILFILPLLLIAGCAHSPSTSSPVNIDGVWKGEYDGPMGVMRLTFVFMSDEQGTGGFFRNESIDGVMGPLEDLRVKGDRIYFTFISHIPQVKMTYNFKGKIQGDLIRLSFRAYAVGSVGLDRSITAVEPSFENEEGKRLRHENSQTSPDGISDPGMNSGSEYSKEFIITRVRDPLEAGLKMSCFDRSRC